ncbi:MAG TPA: L-rhamnose/proton symporter RhaT [Candidatus Angelobacter sp.]|nr:L-rhamnose/proton symporter RhaT [Candidatus Angelobacter sp.]
MPETTVGFLMLVVAGAMNASFTLPMKFTRQWAWENTWLAWTLFALFLFPPVLALLVVPHLGEVYRDAGPGPVLVVAAFGAGWGVAQVFFGLAVEAIGIALTFSIVLGISAAVGSLLPFVRLHPEKLFTPVGCGIVAGVILVIAGVAICAVAGRRREAMTTAGFGPAARSRSMKSGLMLSIACGLGASFVNLGFSFGDSLLGSARKFGASPLGAPNAAWLPLMVAGGIPNLCYCLYLLSKNKTGSRFNGRTVGYWLLALLMAVFWFGSSQLYGISAGKLGGLGLIVGWPLFMSLIVIMASLLGVMTGEWKNSGRQPLRIQFAGVAMLVVAVFVLARASNGI